MEWICCHLVPATIYVMRLNVVHRTEQHTRIYSPARRPQPPPHAPPIRQGLSTLNTV